MAEAPRLPSRQGGSVLQLPFAPTKSGTKPSNVFKDLAELSFQLLQRSEEIQAQTDAREFAELSAQYDSAIRNVSLEASQQPNENFEQLFVEGMSNAQKVFLGNTTNERVQQRLQDHFDVRSPGQIVDARIVQTSIQLEREAVGILRTGQIFAEKIARSTSEVDNERDRALYEALVTSGESRNVFDPKGAQRARDDFKHAIEIEKTKAEKQLKAEVKVATEQQESTVVEGIINNTLDPLDILGQNFITAKDKLFYFGQATKVVSPKTDSALAIGIEDLLTAPVKDEEEKFTRAETAKDLIIEAAKNNQLTVGDATRMYGRANKVLRGNELDKDRWFRDTDKWLKETFGFSSATDRFLNPEGADIFWDIHFQLVREQETKGLSGEAILDRAKQLAKGRAIDFATGDLTSALIDFDFLPPASSIKAGEVFTLEETGRNWRVVNGKWEQVSWDGSKWVEVQ